MPKLDLSNAAKRDALPARSSYYAHPLGSKRYVLLRKGKRGDTWGARVPNKPDVAIGNVAEMSFDVAADLVRKHAEMDANRSDDLRTIGEALDAYVAAAEKTKGRQSMTTINAHVKLMADLRSHKITACKLNTLNEWRTATLTDTRGPATVNKIIGTLKAALNAYGIDGPWQKLAKLKLPKRTVEDRAPVMSPDQVRLVLETAERTDPELFVLLKALWLTGARPSEITSATTRAVNGNALTLTGKTGTRDITLTPGVAQWFAERSAAGRTHLVEFAGKPLGPETHRYRWAALMASLEGQVPAEAGLYVMRHSYITAAIYTGLPVFPLAKHCGTSVEMIENTYGHILADLQAKAFDALEEVLL